MSMKIVDIATTTNLPGVVIFSTSPLSLKITSAGLNIDGVVVTTGKKILVKNEALQSTNGIYTCSQISGDDYTFLMDTTTKIFMGLGIWVEQGTVNSGTVFIADITIPFTPGISDFIVGVDEGTGGGSTPFPPITNSLAVCVNKGGNDITGDGTPNKPFLTIIKAYSVILDATTTKRYNIMVGTGRFDEIGDIVMKPWVWLIGTQRTATRVTSSTNTVRLDSSFGTGNHRWGTQNILFSGSTTVNFDLPSLGGGGGSAVLEMQSTYINNAFSFIGRTTADFIESWQSQFLSLMTLRASQGLIKNCYMGNNILIDDIGATGVNGSIYTLGHNIIEGNITLNKTQAITFQTQLYSNILVGTITTTSASPSLAVTTDTISFPIKSSQTIGANTTLTFISDGLNLKYSEQTPSSWNTAPTTIGQAIDQRHYQKTTAITAFAGGGQGSATQLGQSGLFIVTTATNGDSVKLPAATAQTIGSVIYVSNIGPNSCSVFPTNGQNIQGLANDTATTLILNASSMFITISATTLLKVF